MSAAKRSQPAEEEQCSTRVEATGKRRALLLDERGASACGWAQEDGATGGRGDEAPADERSMFAGDLTLPLRLVPTHVPPEALTTGEDGSIAVDGCIYQGTGIVFARVASVDGLTEAARLQVGAVPLSAIAPRRESRKNRKKQRAGAVLPAEAVVLAVSSAGDRAGALFLALLRLQTRGYIALRCSTTAASFVSNAAEGALRLRCAVWLLASAFVAADDSPDDHDTRNPDLALLLDALAERGTSAAAADSNLTARAETIFSAHRFYETLRRTARESPTMSPTPEGMVCSLRPYQARALSWMISRETSITEVMPVSHPLWSELTLPGGTQVWANRATGRLSRRKAWYRQNTCGGILADEMGLGKTVEVLALVLSCPCAVAECLQPSSIAELLRRPSAPRRGGLGPEFRLLARLLNDIKQSADAAAFLAPAVELFTPDEIPGYQSAVKHPMDLRTVETRLHNGFYSTPEHCANDVRLIFHNCWKYNHRSHAIYQCAERLSVVFERRYKSILVDDASALVSVSERCLKGTLIIAPHSILQQWRDEITQHAPNVKVEVYSGLHSVTTFDEKGYAKTEDLTKVKKTDDLAAEEMQERKRQARLLELTKADIVLTTYQTLRREVHYASDLTGGGTRSLRYEKVYAVPTCPLLSFAWHRVVLDEAQMVESTTAAVATMALRIRARYRWCVTGTPVGAKGVEDLRGLLVFLRHGPFSRQFWWEQTLMRIVSGSGRQGTEILRSTFRPIMWRNSKAHVKDELGVPPMTQKLVKLELTTAEREIYNRILKGIRTAAVHGELAESELMQLRLACAHPQMTRFWSSLQTEGQVQGVQGGGTSLSMSEILERMITMAQQDMEKHERDMCKHLTHLALALLKTPTVTTPKKQASRKRIRFADEMVDAEVREADDHSDGQSETETQPADTDSQPTVAASSAENARQALLVLTKAVRVADDGLQVLEKDGEKQTQLETSAGALKSWRLVEIALYHVLAEVFRQLEDDPTPEEPLPESIVQCIVCSTAATPVSHVRCKRSQCALDLIPKKKTEIFEQTNQKEAELEGQLQRVRDQIAKLCGDTAIDREWNRHVHEIAKPYATKSIGSIPGLRGLAGVAGTENSALREALDAEKKAQSEKKHDLNEKLRRLEAEHVRPFTESLYNLHVRHHQLMRVHRDVMRQLLQTGLSINAMIDGDLERQLGGSRPLDRSRSPTLTAAERRIFLQAERKEAFETGVDQRDRSALRDITVYKPVSSTQELTVEALGTEQKLDVETWSEYYTRQGRRNKAIQHAERHDQGSSAALAADDGSAVAAVAGRDLIRYRVCNIKTCLAHCRATESLKALYNASAEEINAKVADGRLLSVVRKVVDVIETYGSGSAVVAEPVLARGAKPAVLDRAAQGTKMLKYINENLRKELRQLKDVRPAYPELSGWARLAKHRQEVFHLNCRLHFLRQVEVEDRCVRQLLMSELRRREVQKECDRAQTCEEYHARLGVINTQSGLLAERQQLRQRAARSEREGVRQLHHAKFLQNKHEEALKEAASKDRTDEAGTLCPVCLQIVDEGLLMVCGHFFCSGCTDKLLAEPRATCGICRAKISKRSLFRVSGNAAISTDATAGDTSVEADIGSIHVRGDFGTKINALVRFLKHHERQHLRHKQVDNSISRSASAVGAEAPDDDFATDAFTFDEMHPPKALVFSQWETELILVSKALAMNEIAYVELKGTMQQRSASLHRFNVDPDVRVFLLATGVANAGLTLVNATSVFILEPSLNPAIEEQAINRIHRIGQTRPTTAYRFVVADSVEETILDLHSAKRGSFELSDSADISSSRATDRARLSANGHHEEEDASVRRWDTEGIERSVLSSLTDTILSPRRSSSIDDNDDGDGDNDDNNLTS